MVGPRSHLHPACDTHLSHKWLAKESKKVMVLNSRWVLRRNLVATHEAFVLSKACLDLVLALRGHVLVVLLVQHVISLKVVDVDDSEDEDDDSEDDNGASEDF